MAFLVLLESLTPVERAVFLLREVFDYEYAEIAEIVGKEEAACRQLFSRAKKHITDHQPRFEPSPEAHSQIVSEFIQAIEAGNLERLVEHLAEDVVWWSDGGGKATAATHPLYGREQVYRFVKGLMRFRTEGFTFESAEVNGKVGGIARLNGQLFGVFAVETDGQHITAVHAVLNPEKLAHLSA
jgi:RNA polymerase sigma-70 factor (ECF subfamily)